MPACELGPIRPPSESTSLLVRLTRNCPWNRCAFCAVYKGERFSRRTTQELIAEIDRLGQAAMRVRRRLGFEPHEPVTSMNRALGVVRDASADYDERRMAFWLTRGEGKVFLQDADSLVQPASRLVPLLTELRRVFPEIREITTYARSRTLCAKTVGDLLALKDAGLTRVHVGLESGSDAVLALIEKGCTSEHHVKGCLRALEAGLEVACYVMPGLGGRTLTQEHAEQTAVVLRRISPKKVRLRTLWVDPGSPLEAMVENGRFSLLEEHEVVAEIRTLLKDLAGAPVAVVSDHDRNLLSDLEGRLDTQAEQLIAQCDRFLSLPAAVRDAFVLARRSGYALYLESFLGNPAAVERFSQWSQQLVAVGGGSLLQGMRKSLGRRSI